MLKDKVVLITGANKGIGKSIAKIFGQSGAKLLLTGRTENELATLCNELRERSIQASYFVGDVRNELSIQQLIAATLECYGKIDIVCHSAGIYPRVPLEDMTLADWRSVIDTNLTSTFLITKETTPHLKQQKNSAIVIVSSISGPKTGYPELTHYCASKAGVNGFIRSAAIELAKYNIRINGVEPGNVLTEGFDALGQERLIQMQKAIPLGRLADPKEIADTCLFLASDLASYITGQTIVVDGGQILPESSFLEF